MADIFISYTHDDRPKAKALADAFIQQGYSVWWDPKIPPGKPFDEIIEKALNEAKCVIVLWSKKSVKKHWVKEEATEGRRREIYVPVMIEDVDIPMGFKRIQAADLRDWEGEMSHSGFASIMEVIAKMVGAPTSISPEMIPIRQIRVTEPSPVSSLTALPAPEIKFSKNKLICTAIESATSYILEASTEAEFTVRQAKKNSFFTYLSEVWPKYYRVKVEGKPSEHLESPWSKVASPNKVPTFLEQYTLPHRARYEAPINVLFPFPESITAPHLKLVESMPDVPYAKLTWTAVKEAKQYVMSVEKDKNSFFGLTFNLEPPRIMMENHLETSDLDAWYFGVNAEVPRDFPTPSVRSSWSNIVEVKLTTVTT